MPLDLVSTFDAAVIGSGPNGLAAAVRLAQAGRRVVVYEARDTLGGGARTEERTLPGFRHDVCSAIHPMAIGSPYLRTLDLAAHGLHWIHAPLPLAHPLDDGSAVVLARSVDETAAQWPRDDSAYRRLFADLATDFDALARDAMAPLGLPREPALLARFGLRALRSAKGIAGWFAGAPARALLAGLAGHSVLPLEQLTSAAIGIMLGAAGHAVGWPMPRGGAQSLTEALASLLRSLGGVTRTGVAIARLDEVETQGPVIFDTAPRAMADICGAALPAGFRERLRRYRYGPGVCKVDWALSAPIPWRAPQCAQAGTVHLGGTFEEIAASERAAWRGERCPRPYVLVAQPSLFDATRAPPGQHVGWGYCHVPHGSSHDATEAIEAQIERFAPGFREVILARRTTTAVALEAHNPNNVGGDVTGGAADLAQLFFRPVARARPHTTPNPRVFLCSASTPPGGGVHGMGGFFAAEQALARGGHA